MQSLTVQAKIDSNRKKQSHIYLYVAKTLGTSGFEEDCIELKKKKKENEAWVEIRLVNRLYCNNPVELNESLEKKEKNG